MSTENLFEVAGEGTTPRFNALESAAPSALKEFPVLIPENRALTNDSILYDSTQNKPFEITDGQGRVIATAPDTRDGLSDITDGSIGLAKGGCDGCGCSEYTVTGWNRSQFSRNQFSSFSDGDDDDIGDGYDPGDDQGDEYEPDDDYYPEDDDGGGCGPGGGFLRGLLARFGRGGLLSGLFGGGGMRFGRFLRF